MCRVFCFCTHTPAFLHNIRDVYLQGHESEGLDCFFFFKQKSTNDDGSEKHVGKLQKAYTYLNFFKESTVFHNLFNPTELDNKERKAMKM